MRVLGMAVTLMAAMGAEAGVGGGTDTRRRTSASGRKGADRQAAVPDEKVLDAGMEDVVTLIRDANKANEALSEGVKELAKKSGFLASVVRALGKAKAADKVADKKREVGQMALAFGVDE